MTEITGVAPASFLIYGDSKVGKTWLAASAPKPLLTLDAEAGGMRYVPGRQTVWDVMSDDPPAMDDHDICTVQVRNVQQLDATRDWIISGKHPFRSVVLDSITDFQSRFKRSLTNNGQKDMGFSGWETLLSRIESTVVDLRDACEDSDQLLCFVVVAGAENKDRENVQQYPMMKGQIKRVLPYKLDVCGYLSQQTDNDGNTRRLLQVEQSPSIFAGNRLGGAVDSYIWDPDLSDIMQTLHRFLNERNL